jgi:predicted MPP superfamily phosphohydrolase
MKILVTADLHLRGNKPRCRLDEDWYLTQAHMLVSIMSTAKRYKVEAIAIAGDIFHTSRVEQAYESLFIQTMSDEDIPVFIMPGQHDLPGHSFSRIYDSSFGVIWTHAEQNTGGVGILPMQALMDWEEFQGNPRHIHESNRVGTEHILCVHRTILPDGMTIPSNKVQTPQQALDEVDPKYKVILSGDVHQKHVFIAGSRSEHKGRMVIVPGCAIRQKTEEQNIDPSVVILDTETKEYEFVSLHDELSMITDEYITKKKQQEAQIGAFMEAVSNATTISLSYEDNVREALKADGITDLIEEEVLSMIGWEDEKD